VGELDLRECPDVSDVGLVALAAAGDRIRALDLGEPRPFLLSPVALTAGRDVCSFSFRIASHNSAWQHYLYLVDPRVPLSAFVLPHFSTSYVHLLAVQ